MDGINAKYTYLDRHGRPLKIGQKVIVQRCAGLYGQVSQVRGELLEIDAWSGVRIRLSHEHDARHIGRPTTFLKAGDELYIPSVFARQGGAMTGYCRSQDVEHGHEQWIEIQAE